MVLSWLLCQGMGSAWALKIQLDYSLDTNDFFRTEGSPQRIAMRAVADYFESLITDELSEIDPEAYGGNVSWSATVTHPGTGEVTFLENPSIRADTIVVYVGGRSLGTNVLGRAGPGRSLPQGNEAWRHLVLARGETNPDGSPAFGFEAKDFAPWGGSIVFNTDFRWNLSLTRRRVDGLWGEDFVSVALHEMCHVLGIGTSTVWDGYIHQDVMGNVTFVGPHSVAEFGRAVPMEPIVLAHWQDPLFCQPRKNFDPDNPRNVLSKTIKQFGDPGNRDQIALMNPSICSAAGVLFRVMTRLDVASLRDVGWTLRGDTNPRTEVSGFEVRPVSQGVEIKWPAQVGHFYQVEWSERLDKDWVPLNEPDRGLGVPMRLIHGVPGSHRFYRLLVEQR